MTLTDAQRKAAILDEIGDGDGYLAARIDAQWEKLAAYAAAPALRDLHVKRALIDIAYGQARTAVDFTDGDHSQRASQAATALLKLRDAVTAEIATLAEVLLFEGAGGAATGELTTVSPTSPPTLPLVRPFGPDALDPEYLGDPYYPVRTVRGRRW